MSEHGEQWGQGAHNRADRVTILAAAAGTAQNVCLTPKDTKAKHKCKIPLKCDKLMCGNVKGGANGRVAMECKTNQQRVTQLSITILMGMDLWCTLCSPRILTIIQTFW